METKKNGKNSGNFRKAVFGNNLDTGAIPRKYSFFWSKSWYDTGMVPVWYRYDTGMIPVNSPVWTCHYDSQINTTEHYAVVRKRITKVTCEFRLARQDKHVSARWIFIQVLTSRASEFNSRLYQHHTRYRMDEIQDQQPSRYSAPIYFDNEQNRWVNEAFQPMYQDNTSSLHATGPINVYAWNFCRYLSLPSK